MCYLKKSGCIKLFVMILFLFQPLSAQDIWRSALKELFSKMSQGQTDLQTGKISSIELIDDQPEMVTFQVKVADTTGVSRGVITALVMNQERTFPQAFVPPLKMISSTGDYKIFIKRKYKNQEITTDSVSVILVDLGGLNIVDSKIVQLSKSWGQEGTTVADQSLDTDSGYETEEEYVIPDDIDITPVPVGDTPTAESEQTQQSDSSSGNSDATENKPTLNPNLNVNRTARLQLKPIQAAIINLTGLASSARWVNGVKTLPFGVEGKEDGTVRVMPKAYLNNGKQYKTVLYTHCRWADRGYVSGTFSDIRIPAKATRFTTHIGFIRGATKAKDFDFVVRFYPLEKGLKPVLIGSKRITYRSGVVNFTAPIPANLQGIKGNLAMSVQAVSSSGQGWTVWYNPTIE